MKIHIFLKKFLSRILKNNYKEVSLMIAVWKIYKFFRNKQSLTKFPLQDVYHSI